MSVAGYDVPDQQLDDPRQDEEITPEQALDDGDKEAVAAFMDYMRSDFMKWELEEFLRSHDWTVTVRTWIQDWSDKVQRGEI